MKQEGLSGDGSGSSLSQVTRAAHHHLSGEKHDQLRILKHHCGCHVENKLEERKSGENSRRSAPSILD